MCGVCGVWCVCGVHVMYVCGVCGVSEVLGMRGKARVGVGRTRHGTMDWFQIRKGVRQGCILSPCLFNLYAEYIM